MRTTGFVFSRVLVVVIVGFAMVGCWSKNGVLSRRPGGAMLHIENANFADMDVYAVTEVGLERRLGTATGLSESNFVLPYDTFAAGQVYIVARPIGGFGLANSGAINVFSGQYVNFTIHHVLGMSSVWVR